MAAVIKVLWHFLPTEASCDDPIVIQSPGGPGSADVSGQLSSKDGEDT